MSAPRLLFVLNDAPYFLSHRLGLARRAVEAGYDVHVATPPHPRLVEIARAGFTTHTIPLTRRSMVPTQEFGSIRALRRLYRETRPDIVHHLTIKPMIYGGIAARLTGVPCVVYAVTGRGFIASASGVRGIAMRLAARAGYRIALKHPNKSIIFQNPDDRSSFLSLGLAREDEAELIPGSGVDPAIFRPIEGQEEEPIVVLASRMLREKGIGEFVEAARILSSRGRLARFVLVGDTDPGNPGAVTRETLEDWAKEGAVEWWGQRNDIATLFARASIVCLPSYYGEGVPRVLIEAASCARPIVTTDMPGCREIVIDQENGLLVPPRDAHALAEALDKLLLDADLRVRMGLSGRARVLAGFTEGAVVDQTLAIYRRLLSSVAIRPDGSPQPDYPNPTAR